MMKVLFLTNGGSNFDRIVLEKLVERGYETWYVYLRSKGHAYQIPGVHSVYLGYEVTRSEGLLSFKLFHRLKAYWRFRKLLKEVKPDILHAGWVQGPGFMAAVSGYHPFVLMPWGSDILLFPQRNRLFHWMTTFTLKRADAIYCDAQTVKRRIQGLSDYRDDDITVFPCAADLGVFHRDEEDRQSMRKELGWEGNQVVIMTRALEPLYGIEYFLRSLPGLLEAAPGARVLMLGSGSLEAEARGLVGEMGIGDRVRLLGEVPNLDLPKYLSASDLYVSSSLSDGTSMSLIEAMACSLPAVVTDLPANREWIEEGVNGYVVPPKDSQALTKAMVTALSDAEPLGQMGVRNLALAQEKADWKANFGRLEEVYQRLAGSRREGKRGVA